MDDTLLEQAVGLIARGEDVEGLLTGQWSPAASALRALSARVRELVEAADEVETQIHDAVGDAVNMKVDEALDSCRWSCVSPDCKAPASGLAIDRIARRCPGCGGHLLLSYGS